MAMTPRLAATFSQLAMPPGFRKVSAAEDGEEDQDGDQAEGGPGLGAAQEPAKGNAGHRLPPVLVEIEKGRRNPARIIYVEPG